MRVRGARVALQGLIAETYKTINVLAMYVATQDVSSLSATRRTTGVERDNHRRSSHLKASECAGRGSCPRQFMC